MSDFGSRSRRTAADRRRAGHQEVVGETLARIEFFEQEWNPYSRFLDTEKIDLLLRRKIEGETLYREVQVKYGRLYPVGSPWEKKLFDVTSWRFFKDDEFDEYLSTPNLFIAYVLAAPEGYRGDLFLFTVQEFVSLIRSAPRSGEKGRRKVYLSRLKDEPRRWVLRTASRKFDSVTAKTVIDVTDHRQAFHKLLQTGHGT